jgi:phage terminase small subunit
MPVLSNARHERFVQSVFQGKSVDESYREAGYKSHRQNAHRLITKDDIRARLTELQSIAAKASEVTVASVLAELEEARQKASSLDQLSATVRAIEGKARIAGLLTTKIEVTHNRDNWDTDTPLETIANDMLAGVGSPIEQFRPVDLKDREGLTALLDRVGREIYEYLASIKARPIVAERVDVNKLPADWRELELHAQPRLTNGQRR